METFELAWFVKHYCIRHTLTNQDEEEVSAELVDYSRGESFLFILYSCTKQDIHYIMKQVCSLANFASPIISIIVDVSVYQTLPKMATLEVPNETSISGSFLWS